MSHYITFCAKCLSLSYNTLSVKTTKRPKMCIIEAVCVKIARGNKDVHVHTITSYSIAFFHSFLNILTAFVTGPPTLDKADRNLLH